MHKRIARIAGLVGAMMLAACGTAGQGASPNPGATPALLAEASPLAASAAELKDPTLPGRLIEPGTTTSLGFDARAGLVVVANPTDAAAAVSLIGAPTGPAPTPRPSGGASSGSPFGSGFGSLGADRVPITATRKLKGTDAAAPATISETTFWVNDGSATVAGDQARDAICRLVSPHLAVWVDKAIDREIKKADLERLAEAFESRIRPALTARFGEEDTPGIDGDPRLSIVISPWVGQAPGRTGMLGYFWARDAVAREGAGTDPRQHANQREVVFFSAALLTREDVSAFGSLAHEYQHLLTFCAKRRAVGAARAEETWLDEGISMVAMDLAGYGLMAGDPVVGTEVRNFQEAPDAYSLTDWAGNPDGLGYGPSYMFLRYLAERFGPGMLPAIAARPETGMASVDGALRERGSSFTEAFLAWTTAMRPGGSLDLTGGRGEVSLPGMRAPVSGSPVTLRPWGFALLTPATSMTFARPSAPLRVLAP